MGSRGVASAAMIVTLCPSKQMVMSAHSRHCVKRSATAAGRAQPKRGLQCCSVEDYVLQRCASTTGEGMSTHS